MKKCIACPNSYPDTEENFPVKYRTLDKVKLNARCRECKRKDWKLSNSKRVKNEAYWESKRAAGRRYAEKHKVRLKIQRILRSVEKHKETTT